ncbi:acetate--CoA ligase family protein [Haloechinothrix salitolerans]|uniref:Acetate--CoA ligase family protein n=1 Tax=Haloechinothrix salitolerans TaxID=926830 RepID=A0ABW2C2V6_9PSEU
MLTTASALAAVFAPRRIALVGASDRDGSAGRLFWDNLRDFPGEVVPVTPSSSTVDGVSAVASLRDVEGAVDLAVVVSPAASVPGVIADAAARGVPAAVVISGGFAEAGPEGARLQAEMMAAAWAGGVRIIGPNCFGVQNCGLPLNASLGRGLPAGGGISVVTQSGAYGMAIHTLGRDEHARFAKVCATGNKADVGDADLLRYLGDDPATTVICFLSESMPDGRAFIEAAREITPHKPVIVARLGRSAAGARAALSHTAALASQDRVARAALADAGAIVVRSGLEMLDAARALDARPHPAGARVGIVTNSGGTGVELTDLLVEHNLLVPELSPGLRAELRALLPAVGSPHNPVDMTTVWHRYTELYPALIDRIARSGEVDVVVPVLLHRSASEEVSIAVRAAVAALRADGVAVPVYACWVADRDQRAGAKLLQEAGVPCFDWPERTARAVAHAAEAARNADPLAPSQPDHPSAPGPPATAPATVAAQPIDRQLDVEQAADLLRNAGIDVLPSTVCHSERDAVRAARGLGYPVVAKVVHPNIAHKSDVGGVRTDLRNDAALRAAAREILAIAPGASVLVQPHRVGVEVIVGGIRDASFGPAVVAGLGGVFAETVDDVVFALAPCTEADAHRLLRRMRGYPLLAGARGQEPVDLAALAALVTRVSELLAATPWLSQLDLNPVLCGARHVIVSDWRLYTQNQSPRDETARRDSPGHGGEMARRSP